MSGVSRRPFEPALAFYRLATTMLGPLAPALLNWRRRRGKEDPRRMAERMGHASLARPAGPLVWLHGASVGEGIALLPLVERLAARGFNVLVTTGTVTSATILANRLPAGAQHQYLPLDISRFMARFLDHWRPDLALVAESEIWPNMLRMVHERGVPLALVNARLSERSFARWSKAPNLIGSLLSRVDLCLAQTQDDAFRLHRLGAENVQVAGNLKYDVPAPPYAQQELAQMTAAVGARPVWFAASTHPGEEEIILGVHQRLLHDFPDLLTIVAPRHARRGQQIAELAASFGAPSALRSLGDKITPATQFYIADTWARWDFSIGSPAWFWWASPLAARAADKTLSSPQNWARLFCTARMWAISRRSIANSPPRMGRCRSPTSQRWRRRFASISPTPPSYGAADARPRRLWSGSAGRPDGSCRRWSPG